MPTDADQQDRDDHMVSTDVPLVPDEVADAGAADQHFGRDDTSQAIPIEIRMPVRIVGAAARQITVEGALTVPTSSVRATLIHSLRTLATPNAVLRASATPSR